jgi:hypothetical protein
MSTCELQFHDSLESVLTLL